MTTLREARELFLQLFLEGRYIPKIQALADAADRSLPGSRGGKCPECEAEATCPVCNYCFKSHHPRNHHDPDRSLSVNSVCASCGEALTLGDIINHAVEITPCAECYSNMSASDLKDTTYYFQL